MAPHNSTNNEDWRVEHIIQGDHGMQLRIQRRRFPKIMYSIQIGRERRIQPGEAPNDKLQPFLPVFDDDTRPIADMVAAAYTWIAEDRKQQIAASREAERAKKTV